MLRPIRIWYLNLPWLQRRTLWDALAIIFSLAALAAHFKYFRETNPYTSYVLFMMAVVLSALWGGLRSGLIASVASSVLIVFFMHGPQAWAHAVPAEQAALLIFILGSALFSFHIGHLHEEALAKDRVEARFKVLVEGSHEFITMRAEDGGLIYMSPAVRRVLGLTFDEVSASGLGGVIHPEDAPLARDIFTHLKPGETRHGIRMRVRDKDGNWHWLEGSIGNHLNDRAVKAMVSNFRDVSDSVHLQEEMAHAMKMESIGRIAGSLAHDFNNVLTVIAGETELALEQEGLPQAARRGIESIHDAMLKAATFTNQLTTFARKGTCKPVSLDLNKLLDRAAPMLRRLLGDEIELNSLLSMDLLNVRADPLQLEQVLMNLAANSRDAMPKGGIFTLRTANAYPGGGRGPKPAWAQQKAYVMLTVSDTGVGMSREALRSAFEPFFTTKEARKGLGLGLSTTYGILKQAGGHIEASSQLGKGTTFTIYLPASMERPVPLGSLKSLPLSKYGVRLNVLLVEDEESLRRLISRVLEKMGYQVTQAGHGEEALMLAKKASFDLLISDVSMPKLGGKELAQQLRTTTPNLKVLFISGYSENATALQEYLDSGTYFLMKPFSPGNLSAKLREILEAQEA